MILHFYPLWFLYFLGKAFLLFQFFYCDASGTQGVFSAQIGIHSPDILLSTEEAALNAAINTVVFPNHNIIFPGEANRTAVGNQFLFSHNAVFIPFPQVRFALWRRV